MKQHFTSLQDDYKLRCLPQIAHTRVTRVSFQHFFYLILAHLETIPQTTTEYVLEIFTLKYDCQIYFNTHFFKKKFINAMLT